MSEAIQKDAQNAQAEKNDGAQTTQEAAAGGCPAGRPVVTRPRRETPLPVLLAAVGSGHRPAVTRRGYTFSGAAPGAEIVGADPLGRPQQRAPAGTTPQPFREETWGSWTVGRLW